MSSPISAADARAGAPCRRPLWDVFARRDGATAVGFALLLPLVMLFTLGFVDFSVLLLDHHRAGDAVRRAARQAAIEPPIPDLSALPPGGSLTCRSGGGGVSCDGAALANAEGFATLVAAARSMLPRLSEANLVVTYRDVGLGDAALPSGVIPMIGVELDGVTFTFSALRAVPGLPQTLTLPTFRSMQVGGGAAPE